MLRAISTSAGRRWAAGATLPVAGLGASYLSSTTASAAAVPATATDSPYLRFGSPEPLSVTEQQTALGYVPLTKVTTLPNGFRIATETTPHAKTATVGLWIDAGTRYETSENNGAAHFLEHMAFKGTPKRSVSHLEVEVENIGGHLNAYTSREQTCYYAKVLKQDIPQAVDILSDILQNSTMDEAAVERERGVILREMQEVEGVAEEVVFDHLHATAFQFSPLGRTILGSAENVKKLTRGDLADYIATHYSAPRMVLSASGGVDHDELVALASSAFSGLQEGGTSVADLLKEGPAKFTGSMAEIADPDMPKVHLALAFQGVSWSDPDAVALMVMQTMLGGWNSRLTAGIHMGSRVAQLMAANGLCDSYMAFNTNYHDTGLFGMYATGDPETAEDMSWTMINNMTKMVYAVEESDVTRAKNQLKAQTLFAQDGTSGTAEDIGRQLLTYGRRLSKEELFARIDAVDADVVKRVAERIIYNSDMAICTMGNTVNVPDYQWFRRRTFWMRY